VTKIHSPLRLKLDRKALADNWRALDGLGGTAATGGAIKANGYGLGAKQVTTILQEAGCRDFFVATWQEAEEVIPVLEANSQISVLNGVGREELSHALNSGAKPVLNSLKQAKRWSGTGVLCDVMTNSGMNRLGIDLAELNELKALDLKIDILMSHMASADEDVIQNDQQLNSYQNALKEIPYRRSSLANSAAIALGHDYHFDLTRPGLSLYGGKPRHELENLITQVVYPEAQILQKRHIKKGAKVGYNATFEAPHDMDVAIIAIGYADGYLRAFSGKGQFSREGTGLPVIGRVSMDLVALDISENGQLQEGDWVACDFDLANASEISGLSQYELLTGLGQRYERIWV